MAVAQAKEGIEKELTCPLCLEIFTDPKRLPCDHIYCKDPCLKGLVLRSLNSTITCPECRTVAQVPNYDVDTFPTAFQINRLKELYRNMQDKDETDSPQIESPKQQREPATCEVHASQPIALYCETCEEVLCRDCLLKSDKHKRHDYGFIEEVADKQRKAITNQLKLVKELESQLVSALEEISQEKAHIVNQGKSHSDQIEDTFQATIVALTEEKEILKSVISRNVQRKMSAITTQEEKLTTCLSELSDTIKQMENSVQSQSHQEIACNKSKYFHQLQEASDEVEGLSLQPTVKADIGLCLMAPGRVGSYYKEGNNQYQLADPQKCVLEGFRSFEVGNPNTATLQLTDSEGKRCTHPQQTKVELQCIRENSVRYGQSTPSVAGNLSISVTPQRRGRHEVSVRVNGFHIAHSPISVYVHTPPQQLRDPSSTIADIQNPAALYCFREKLYILTVNFHDNNSVFVLNESRERLQAQYFRGINEMVIDSETEDMFVTDVHHHQLLKLNKHGKRIKTVGRWGTGPQQFDYPNGIQISRGGEVFVCDTRNHRIKVYDKELHLQRVIGTQGTKKGCFNSPDNLAFDESGNLFVTEAGNNRVQVISPDGKTIRIIGKQGSKPGELNRPVGIAIGRRHVYIAEAINKRISVFTTQGDFVTTFGSGYLERPECIAIDRDGYVYVSDNREKVFIF